MVEIGSHNHQVAFLHTEEAVENLNIRPTPINIDHFRIIVPVHAHVVASGMDKEPNVNGEGRIEPVGVDTLGIDPRFHNEVGLLPGKAIVGHDRISSGAQ
jgi:hypothetical protein